jgi:hypothetical protein
MANIKIFEQQIEGQARGQLTVPFATIFVLSLSPLKIDDRLLGRSQITGSILIKICERESKALVVVAVIRREA